MGDSAKNSALRDSEHLLELRTKKAIGEYDAGLRDPPAEHGADSIGKAPAWRRGTESESRSAQVESGKNHESARTDLLRCNVSSHSERSVELHLQHEESRIGAKLLIV